MKRKTVYFSNEIKLKIQTHARQEYPSECCGILFGKSAGDGKAEVMAYEPMQNECRIENKSRHFFMDPLKLYSYEMEYRKRGLEIIGFMHSHPDAVARPSELDERDMIPGQLYMILALKNSFCIGIRVWEKSLEKGYATELPLIIREGNKGYESDYFRNVTVVF